MKNLDQIRASHALKASQENVKYAGEQDGEVIKKIPPHIMNYGLLASAAFAFGEKKDGWRNAFDAIAKHLSDTEIGLLPAHCDSLRTMVQYLTRPEATSQELKIATLETMAWLNFARRFITKGSGSGNEDSEE